MYKTAKFFGDASMAFVICVHFMYDHLLNALSAFYFADMRLRTYTSLTNNIYLPMFENYVLGDTNDHGRHVHVNGR